MSTRTHEVAGPPEEEPRRDTAQVETNQERPRVSQDRLRDLINALGDPNHPLHSQAVNDLVDIGEPAVNALSSALSSNYPWLTSYRAAEALAQIGDGRASGALINALRHPNSNVRWSVVRALSEVGDTRTLLALRRVVHEDHGKTSWGESVADTAQLALDRLQSRSALLRFSEPIKTALVFVAMLAVLAFAGNRVQALREELGNTQSNVPAPVVSGGGNLAETATTEPEESPTPEAATPTPSVVAAADEIVGTVKASGNVRNGPNREARRIGQVTQGDEVVFLAKSGTWYRVRLGEEVSE
ncbi:MAG: HEAT repeat domain-containing protein, partial [Chloroflexi bacterium]|nr:HEAT repeat domain-containing protein [Chloroflexota bacterium]